MPPKPIVVKTKPNGQPDLSVLTQVYQKLFTEHRNYVTVRQKFHDQKSQGLYLMGIFMKLAKFLSIPDLEALGQAGYNDVAAHGWPVGDAFNDPVALLAQPSDAHGKVMWSSYTAMNNNPFLAYGMQFSKALSEYRGHFLEPKDSAKPKGEKVPKKLALDDAQKICDKILDDPMIEFLFDIRFDAAYMHASSDAKAALETVERLKKVNLAERFNKLPENDRHNNLILLFGMLRLIMLTVSNIGQIIVLPDLSADIIGSMLKQITENQDAKVLQKHAKALSVLDKASELFNANFADYYREYVLSGDISVMLQMAISDCTKLDADSNEISALGQEIFKHAEKRFAGNSDMKAMIGGLSQIFTAQKPIQSKTSSGTYGDVL